MVLYKTDASSGLALDEGDSDCTPRGSFSLLWLRRFFPPLPQPSAETSMPYCLTSRLSYSLMTIVLLPCDHRFKLTGSSGCPAVFRLRPPVLP